MKRRHSIQHAPTSEEVQDEPEADALRKESIATRQALQALRNEISDTISELRSFGEQLKEANRV